MAVATTSSRPLRVLVAPNALKGSCTAVDAARALADGVRRVLADAEIGEYPVADGGDGLVEVALHRLGAEARRFSVTGPLFRPVDAQLAWLPQQRTAIIEMAQASGLVLLGADARDPSQTTSLGTGELMRQALDLGAETLIVGLGGSATNDGGIGVATALGWRLLDAGGQPVKPIGAMLPHIAALDDKAVDPRLRRIRVKAVCDVDNPLTGPAGAAVIYAPQKGASPAMAAELDHGLRHLAERIRCDIGRDPEQVPGAGAAGGLGAGLMAFCDAQLQPGAEVVLELVGLDAALQAADLVLTAEGQVDGQTRFGKAPAAVAAHARRHAVPCFAIAGSIGEGIELLHGIGLDAVFSLCPGPISLAEAEQRAEALLADAAEQAVRAFVAGRRPGAQR